VNGDDRELEEVRRILRAAGEEGSEAERRAVVAAARPELSRLRRRAAAGEPRRFPDLRWWLRPRGGLAWAVAALALVAALLAPRETGRLRAANVATFAEHVRGASSWPRAAAVFEGLE
jgi:hypothetical protein